MSDEITADDIAAINKELGRLSAAHKRAFGMAPAPTTAPPTEWTVDMLAAAIEKATANQERRERQRAMIRGWLQSHGYNAPQIDS